MFEGIFAAYPVGWDPLEHLGYEVRALINIFLGIVLEWKDLPEITARRIIELVDQVDSVLSYLTANSLECFPIGQAEEGNLLDQLRALGFAWE